MNLDQFDEQRNIIHLHIRQRTGKKKITAIQGFQKDYDLKKILQTLKKDLCCGGLIESSDDSGETIIVNGDQRDKIIDFLVKHKFADKKDIRVHG